MSRVVFDFTGENFVVTGASSGMGRQVAVELATAGANVLAIARNEARLQELQAQYPANISVAALDVCDSEKMENAIKDFVKEHGKLHGGVHAAGITDITPLKSYDKDKAHKIMDVNFWAGAIFLQYATKREFLMMVHPLCCFLLCTPSHLLKECLYMVLPRRELILRCNPLVRRLPRESNA